MTIDLAKAFGDWDKVLSGENPELLNDNMLLAVGTGGVRDSVLGMAALGTKASIGAGIWLGFMNESWADDFQLTDEINEINGAKFSMCVYTDPSEEGVERINRLKVSLDTYLNLDGLLNSELSHAQVGDVITARAWTSIITGELDEGIAFASRAMDLNPENTFAPLLLQLGHHWKNRAA